MQNNCDGSGPHTEGEVRLLPLGSKPLHGNLILCRACWLREIRFRQGANVVISDEFKFDIPEWSEAEIYPTA